LNKTLKIVLIITGIFMLFGLNSCENSNYLPNSTTLTIAPLNEQILSQQAFLFKILGDISEDAIVKWDFGDNMTKTGSSVKHTYSKPGVYTISLYLESNEKKELQSSAIIRVHSNKTIGLPQVFLDTDARCEADDQHFIAYTLYSDLDVLGINSIHNGDPYSEAINYGEVYNIMNLMRLAGKPWNSMPVDRVFHGATEQLTPPSSGVWWDTEPVITDGSKAILAAARGASPDNPLIVLPVGPCTNVASAILQARNEGFELRDRMKIIWLGGLENDYHEEYNGGNDPWSVYVMGQSGLDVQILLGHPTSLKLNIDKRIESHLYPNNDLGDYLMTIIPVFQWGSTTVLKSIHDVCVPAVVISNYKGYNWVTKTAPVEVTGPENDYRWVESDSSSTVRLIWDIDGEAMKTDLFNTLNGRPTKLIK